MKARRVCAPWTPEQVRFLNDWQRNMLSRPYTCAATRTDGSACRADLGVTPQGFVCPACGHKQTWALLPQGVLS